MIDFMTVMSSAKTSFDVLKTAIDLRDQYKSQMALLEAQGKLLELHTAHLQLQDTYLKLRDDHQTLKEERSELERKLEERGVYQLHEIKAGTFCYRHNASADSQIPAHYLCQPCYDQGVKSVLRLKQGGGMDPPGFYCPENPKHHIYMPT